MADPKRIVYVLKSAVDRTRYYIGSTSDVERRLVAHNAGFCPHTSKYRPWRLHVRIEFSDEPHAAAFERYLKSGSGRAFARRHFD
jgi:predicted GIY-YIG superfamily endonuclease